MSRFLLPFLILLMSYGIQDAVIFPLEKYLRGDGNVDLVSFVFIPHGVKLALILVFGLSIIPIIFLAQLINGAIMQNVLFLDVDIFLSALAGTICFAIPLLIYNFCSSNIFSSAPIYQKNSSYNGLPLFLGFACVASILNSLMHKAIYGFDIYPLGFIFLLGDTLGAISVFFAFVFFIRPYVARNVLKKYHHD